MERKIYVKQHRDVVAFCDADLIGKQLEEGKLALTVTERFYKGELKSDADVKKILADADNANLVGERVVGIALKEGYINKEHIVVIQGVPHAQIYSVVA